MGDVRIMLHIRRRNVLFSIDFSIQLVEPSRWRACSVFDAAPRQIDAAAEAHFLRRQLRNWQYRCQKQFPLSFRVWPTHNIPGLSRAETVVAAMGRLAATVPGEA